MRRENLYFDALAFLATSATVLLAGCTTEEHQRDDSTGQTESHLVAPPVGDFVVLARHSAQFADRVAILSGAVGVAPSANATPNFLSAGPDARIAIGNTSLAQRLVLGTRAGIGDIGANTFELAPEAFTGVRAAYVTPPAGPAIGTFTAGTAAFSVPAFEARSLAPGKRGAVTINMDATLNLEGGLNEFSSLTMVAGAD